jgi:hypothetical protein
MNQPDHAKGGTLKEAASERTPPRRGFRIVFAVVLLGGAVIYALVAARNDLFPFHRPASSPQVEPPTTKSAEPREWESQLPDLPGTWFLQRGRATGETADDRQAREFERLAALGYVDGDVPAPLSSGVTVHQEGSAHQGLNLVVSGHAPEAHLVDMSGETVHTWRFDFGDAFPGRTVPADAKGRDQWRRAHLFENGDLLAIYEGLGLIKIDRESRLLWAYDGHCHHDLEVAGDGSIYVLEREARIIPRLHETLPVLEDFITILEADGSRRERISILEALERSRYDSLLHRRRPAGDIFHTNTIEILDGTLEGASPAFREGNCLVSILRLDTIAVVDLQRREVAWALTGPWREQHQPTVVPGGRLLVFNNRAGPDASSVVEIDPFSQEIVWTYRGDEANPFYTRTCGSNQRLPNGNTLITESNNGRAFEVTPDGLIVWEYISPFRAGDNDQYIANLCELVRLPAAYPTEWTGD